MLAIIAGGGRALVVIYREGVEIKYFIFYFIDLLILIKPFDGSLIQPLAKRLPGFGMFINKNHAAGGEKENGTTMVGMFVFLCLASQKPSK